VGYIVTRLYTTDSSEDSDNLLGIVTRDLLPVLLPDLGLQRYSLLKLDDGRFGSTTMYDDKIAADAGQDMIEAWMRKNAELLEGVEQNVVLQGSRVFSYQGVAGAALDTAYGIIQTYQSDADAVQISAALMSEVQPLFSGLPRLLRFTCLQMHDGSGFVFLTAHTEREEVDLFASKIHDLRYNLNSQLGNLLPYDPVEISGSVVRSFTHNA
jgi:hypothetical protein